MHWNLSIIMILKNFPEHDLLICQVQLMHTHICALDTFCLAVMTLTESRHVYVCINLGHVCKTYL